MEIFSLFFQYSNKIFFIHYYIIIIWLDSTYLLEVTDVSIGFLFLKKRQKGRKVQFKDNYVDCIIIGLKSDPKLVFEKKLSYEKKNDNKNFIDIIMIHDSWQNNMLEYQGVSHPDKMLTKKWLRKG